MYFIEDAYYNTGQLIFKEIETYKYEPFTFGDDINETEEVSENMSANINLYENAENAEDIEIVEQPHHIEHDRNHLSATSEHEGNHINLYEENEDITDEKNETVNLYEDAENAPLIEKKSKKNLIKEIYKN